MPELLTPATVYILAAILLPFVPKGIFRQLVPVLVPFAGVAVFWTLQSGTFSSFNLMGLHIGLMRIDDLSRIFGLIFSIAACLAAIYAWHVRDTIQQVAGLLYAGSAIGAVFAADLITLFVFWEGTAIASVFLIWARRTEGAYATGMRYLIVQIGSGVILMAGVVLLYRETGTVAFSQMELGSLATWMIFIAFGIKCAFPLLHNWLQDAYPAATVTGTVILSAFTTKLAVYALARGFPGTEILIYIGAVMTLFPIFYAVIENDLRRVLAYSLNNQLGFMVVGVGIGTPLALNGTAAHAFCHILYKALLFMSVGAVLFRTGTAKGSELGGLYKTMPWTMAFCVVGAASISAFPLFSGFISKSLILSASADEGHFIVWLILLFASAGVFHHSGIKIPYFAFFAHDSGKRPKEAPRHMLIAMGVTAALCIGIGVYPAPLYELLPYDVGYEPYTTSHVVTQLQLLFFSALAFTVLMKTRVYPPELRSTNLDSDWIYRRMLPAMVAGLRHVITGTWRFASRVTTTRVDRFIATIYRAHGPQGPLARTWPTGSMVLWMAVLLGMTLVLAYI
ncbi:Na(+)/H(+) antiporter subunit D [Parvibaculum sp.]|jgi:multicomponent Na+:H+ antiporter subunit D|uniref:Na(+)/H(+) antiporter subunit D n=1 Tax=Parvibaculum sp. TaxID=2024848 RepID=UPI000C57369A|nr:Na(+)/H(+) antiporter subunit D [Parvibaculum sp.]MAM93731.1 Na(+)/H(+) antiporter subunit D [Parvibaculum sp.]HCX66701.1 Na(+)/H(+) antiporter subunit D [Rhodobiaceae bacterium]|tara:strand:+ start:25652 stop:27346 length:1695 start_codon:yes stop_codon:yes gene_type:complete